MQDLTPNHRHSGASGDGNKIPSRNIDRLEGIFAKSFSISGSSGVGAANLYSWDDFSPRYMIVSVGCRTANAGGGFSKMTVIRGDIADTVALLIRAFNFDASADTYGTSNTNLILTDIGGNTFTFGLIELTKNGITLNWANGDIGMDVRIVVDVYGYSIKYDNILLNKLI